MPPPSQQQPAFAGLALRDRAFEFLSNRGRLSEDELLGHVYGGMAPASVRARLAEPLLADPRLERHADGTWAVRGRPAASSGAPFAATVVVPTGPNPTRARVVRLVLLSFDSSGVSERFHATLNPGQRVPGYVLARIGAEAATLEGQASFADIADALARFILQRAIVAQDARLTWSFVDAEFRRLGRTVREPPLVDINELATTCLALAHKPTLSTVAARLGVPTGHIAQADEEARALLEVGRRLLGPGTAPAVDAGVWPAALRSRAIARGTPDQPGVYVMRDRERQALYVGKARRLRSRLEAYVHRPLGPTRRLEGLVGAVDVVDTTHCASDLEALVLEDREIRRLRPRFNTVRRQRAPRYWINLPPPNARRGAAPRRLDLSDGPGTEPGEFVGPFRNQTLADRARMLARQVFELDRLRRARAADYEAQLAQAWDFLRGFRPPAEALARQRGVRLLRKVLAFDLAAALLPADPRHTRYAVLRASRGSIEGFILDHAILRGFATLEDDDAFGFASRLLAATEQRTAAEDADVVLRWFGAQRPPARLLVLSDDEAEAHDAIHTAVSGLRTEDYGLTKRARPVV
jgi:DNA polymerase III epsilon subunit-like protein